MLPEIEIDVPRRPAHSQRDVHQFGGLIILGSRFYPAEGKEDQARLRSAAHNFVKRTPGWEFETRIETRDGVNGIRVWRIK